MQKTKEKQQTLSNSTKKVVIIVLIAVVGLSLVIGLSALSIQPKISDETGVATLRVQYLNGTVMDAEDYTVSMQLCNYTDADEPDEYVLVPENYEEIELDEEELEEGIELEANCTYMVTISRSGFQTVLQQFYPGINTIILLKTPSAAMIAFAPLGMEGNIQTAKVYITLFDSLNSTDAATDENIGLNAYKLTAVDETQALFLKLDKATDYVAAVLNITYAEDTIIEAGDLYIQLNSNLITFNQFTAVYNILAIGSPTMTLGYADPNDLSSYAEICTIEN